MIVFELKLKTEISLFTNLSYSTIIMEKQCHVKGFVINTVCM